MSTFEWLKAAKQFKSYTVMYAPYLRVTLIGITSFWLNLTHPLISCLLFNPKSVNKNNFRMHHQFLILGDPWDSLSYLLPDHFLVLLSLCSSSWFTSWYILLLCHLQMVGHSQVGSPLLFLLESTLLSLLDWSHDLYVLAGGGLETDNNAASTLGETHTCRNTRHVLSCSRQYMRNTQQGFLK